MRHATRVSPGFPLLATCLVLLIFPSFHGAQQASNISNADKQLSSSTEDPRALYQALNELRPNGAQVYTVHELNLRRDVISLTLIDGKIAFLPSIGGQVTGAVFTGHGHILATPRDPGERRSLSQFVGVPILDQSFSRLYLRFTDDTASEIQEQLKSDGGKESVDSQFAESWNSALASLAPAQSLRIMLDMLSTSPLPFSTP